MSQGNVLSQDGKSQDIQKMVRSQDDKGQQQQVATRSQSDKGQNNNIQNVQVETQSQSDKGQIVQAATRSQDGKGKQIQEIFSHLHVRYDMLSTVLSMGQYGLWVRLLVNRLPKIRGGKYLDVATGTGEFALEMAKRTDKDSRTWGIDNSTQMLELARAKKARLQHGARVKFKAMDAMALEFGENYFDGMTAVFGVRNFADLDKGLVQMFRVLKPGSTLLVLEFDTPEPKIIGWLWKNYYHLMLLPMAGLLADREPFEYMYQSIMNFPHKQEFCNRLMEAGFSQASWEAIPPGVVNLYTAIK